MQPLKYPAHYAELGAQELYCLGGGTVEEFVGTVYKFGRVFTYIGRIFTAIGTMLNAVNTVYTSVQNLNKYVERNF